MKRAIEDELGLDTGDLDGQTEMVKEILLRVLEVCAMIWRERDGKWE